MKGITPLSARNAGLARVIAALACILLLTSTAAGAQRALAQEARPEDTIRIRTEGYLKAMSSGKWLIGDRFILVDEHTIIIEKRGQAEVGAWVIAWGIRNEAGALYGELIQVDRPAGRSGPEIQFSGPVTKQHGTWWVISEMLVRVTESTQISGTPGFGWLVWVVAEDKGTFLEALAIEAIAESPELMPVEFEGGIEALEPGGGRIDGRTFTLAANPEIIGELTVGCTVEMRATLASNDALVARLIRVVDKPATAGVSAIVASIADEGDGQQTWDVILFPEQSGGQATLGVLRVGPNTLVDESRAVVQPDLWAKIRGTEVAQGRIHADVIRLEQWMPANIAGELAPTVMEHSARGQISGQAATTAIAPWSTPSPVARGLTDATQPVLAYTNDGFTHALWESGGDLFYAYRPQGLGWSRGQRIASGMEPTLAVDSHGQLHAIFANQFFGNYEIYHSALEAGGWTLPVNIARTSGVSMKPVLAIGSNGTLHAAWMDNSPGYWTIYAAAWSGNFWSNQPVPNGRGQSPAIAVTSEAKAFFAWQDRSPTPDNPTGTFDIFLSERQGGRWSLPINISDRDDRDAIGVSLATTADGLAQLVWVEDAQIVRYAFGEGVYWPHPQTVAKTAVMARGPHVTVEQGDILHIAWDEGEVLRTTFAPKAPATWPRPEVIMALQGTLKDVRLAVGKGPGIGVTLIWVQTSQPGNTEIYESHRERLTRPRVWLPILHNH